MNATNPLIGTSPADTLNNVASVLEALSGLPDGLRLILTVISAALRHEAQALSLDAED